MWSNEINRVCAKYDCWLCTFFMDLIVWSRASDRWQTANWMSKSITMTSKVKKLELFAVVNDASFMRMNENEKLIVLVQQCSLSAWNSPRMLRSCHFCCRRRLLVRQRCTGHTCAAYRNMCFKFALAKLRVSCVLQPHAILESLGEITDTNTVYSILCK